MSHSCGSSSPGVFPHNRESRKQDLLFSGPPLSGQWYPLAGGAEGSAGLSHQGRDEWFPSAKMERFRYHLS